MSKFSWYGEKSVTTSVTLPRSVFLLAKKHKLNKSNLLRVAILRAIKEPEGIYGIVKQMKEHIDKQDKKIFHLERARIEEHMRRLD